VVAALVGCGEQETQWTFRGGAGPSVLLFSRTTGFRHGSIEPAVTSLQEVGAARGWTVAATEDPTVFEAAALAEYDVVVFLLTTGDVLDEQQQAAFEAFIADSNGYVGVHSASDTEYDWEWYGELLGGYFSDHPAPQDATIDVVDGTHPSTMHLDGQWMRFDEWYNFAPNPARTVDVLLNLDESSYAGGTMGKQHPIAWTHDHGGGRAWYTAGGHTDESWAEPDFVTHVAAGIEWAADDADDPAGSGDVGEASGPTTQASGTSHTSTGTGSGSPTSGAATGNTPGAESTATVATSAPPPDTDTDAAADDDAGDACICTSTHDRNNVWLLLLLGALLRPRKSRDRDV
jgi:type 1 glutamine amidotransferase